MYCDGAVDGSGVPVPLPWSSGSQCFGSPSGSYCEMKDAIASSGSEDLECPQLPKTSPKQLAAGRKHGDPPAGWTCASQLYYEMEIGVTSFTCDCGCGVIDPDCGYVLTSCEDQKWNPVYSKITCGGVEAPDDETYCRLESARCQLLAPGLARGHTSEWECIPDVYNEMADNLTSLNDCDCNCGGSDPDCVKEYNDLYCKGIIDDATFAPIPIPRAQGGVCEVNSNGARCVASEEKKRSASGGSGGVECPQFAATSPVALAKGAEWSIPPLGWTCLPELYYQLDCPFVVNVTCDCGVKACELLQPTVLKLNVSCVLSVWVA